MYLVNREKVFLMSGKVIAQILAAEWTRTLSISADELAAVAPMFFNLGGAAWAWRQIRQTPLRETPTAHDLHQAYRLHTLQVAVKELEIAQVFSHLRSLGLEPLMGKGWAIARHYPEPGLRPFGDIDLYVRLEQYQDVLAAFQTPASQGVIVDIHNGAAELDDRSFDELYARSLLIPVGSSSARIFGPEDNLRLLCLHFLREGALRPLWLCDVAVALETLPSDFDWAYFLGGDPRRTEWVICVLGLAHQLLGIKIDRLPVAVRASALPPWLVPTVLKLWGQGKTTKGRRTRMAAYLTHPAGALKALQERWPNAVEATVGTRGPFNNWPRLPFQLGECVLRTAIFVRQLPKLISRF